jgi:hypothetical protein
MNQYIGTAVLLLDGGRQIACTAHLRKDGAAWHGTFAVPPHARTPALLNLQEGSLRIHGVDGTFVKTNAHMSLPSEEFRMQIEGTGDAPF